MIIADESRLLESLDEAALVGHLVDLVRVPSVTGTDAESELQHVSATQLASRGFEVDAWKFDLDELFAHAKFPGTEVPRTEGYGLVATLGGDGTPAPVL